MGYGGCQLVSATSTTPHGIRMTPRLQDYLQAVNELFVERGACTIRAIEERCHVSSSSTVHDALRRLVAMGHVRRVPKGKLYSYEPTSAPNKEAVAALIKSLREHDGTVMPSWLLEHRKAWIYS